MPTPHDYYAILEVKPDADLALIKSQYRKLVRLNHPDIAPDKETAHARMQLILEAYTVLSDSEKREAYDRSRQHRAAPARSVNHTARPVPGAPRGAPARHAPPRSHSAPSTYGGRPAHRAVGARGPGASRAPSQSSPGGTSTRARLLTMVFDAANLYFEDGRTQEAIAICERVMKADPSNAEAPALLGDIYADQGRIDLAVMNYERAMRRQPHNLLYRQKLESLTQANAPGHHAASSPGHPTAAKVGGCSSQLFLWVLLTATAVAPVLFFYLGGP